MDRYKLFSNVIKYIIILIVYSYFMSLSVMTTDKLLYNFILCLIKFDTLLTTKLIYHSILTQINILAKQNPYSLK